MSGLVVGLEGCYAVIKIEFVKRFLRVYSYGLAEERSFFLIFYRFYEDSFWC